MMPFHGHLAGLQGAVCAAVGSCCPLPGIPSTASGLPRLWRLQTARFPATAKQGAAQLRFFL